MARTALALASLNANTKAALDILAGLGEADEIGIGIAVGQAHVTHVVEVHRLLVDIGASAAQSGPYAVAAAIAALDPQQRGALAEIASLATSETPSGTLGQNALAAQAVRST